MNKPFCIYELIDKTLKQKDNTISAVRLCKMAGVSRSGYYTWVNAATARQAREELDQRDFDLILKAYKMRVYSKDTR